MVSCSGRNVANPNEILNIYIVPEQLEVVEKDDGLMNLDQEKIKIGVITTQHQEVELEIFSQNEVLIGELKAAFEEIKAKEFIVADGVPHPGNERPYGYYSAIAEPGTKYYLEAFSQELRDYGFLTSIDRVDSP